MAKAAPNPAPEQTAKVSGPTRGLRDTPCSVAPEIDSAAPANMTTMILGSRIEVIIIHSFWGKFPVMMLSGFMKYLPVKVMIKKR